jgi:uncharacterized protein YutD
MKREFKVGDRVYNTDLKQKGTINEIDVEDNFCPYKFVDKQGFGMWCNKGVLKHLKPKEKQSDKIRRIVRDEIDRIEYQKVMDKLREPIKLEHFSMINNEPQQPKSGWYKDYEYPKWLMYHDFENSCYFGFEGIIGGWYEKKMRKKGFTIGNYATPATNEEVIERLVEYIKTNNK